MHKVKGQLEQRIQIAMRTSVSRIIINWGNYGSGKTHAAVYFSRTNRLEEISTEVGTSNALSIKLNLPRTSKDIVQAFWRALLGQLSFSSLIQDIHRLRETFTQVDDFEAVISALANDNVIQQLFVQLADIKQDDLPLLESYLYGDSTKSTLGKLNLPIGIGDDEQVVNLISTLFNCLTYNKQIYSTVLLWVDEFEDIDTLSKANADRFTSFLRQLIDKTPNNLTLFLNFTPKRFMNIEDLSVYMGEALLSRAGVRISFDEPTLEESKEYLSELLNNPKFRTKGTGITNKFYPFSHEVATYVLQHIGRRSIRRINEAFSIILELALVEGEQPEITVPFVEKIKGEIIAWEN